MENTTPTNTDSHATSLTQRASPLASMLSPNTDAIRLRRAQALIRASELEQNALINDLERQKSSLEQKLEDLSDLSPDDTTSLKFGKDFDAKKWVADVQDTKEQIEEVKFKLDIAKTTLKEFTQTA